MTEKETLLLEVINKMISLCKPIKYDDFNVIIPAKDVRLLRKAEKINEEIGIANFDEDNEGISTLSIIATITDICIFKRLAFIVEDDGTISGVKFYEPE